MNYAKWITPPARTQSDVACPKNDMLDTACAQRVLPASTQYCIKSVQYGLFECVWPCNHAYGSWCSENAHVPILADCAVIKDRADVRRHAVARRLAWQIPLPLISPISTASPPMGHCQVKLFRYPAYVISKVCSCSSSEQLDH